MKTRKNIAIAITVTLLAVVTVGCSKIASRPEAVTDALQRRADEFVHERHQKWHERARHVSQVVPGVERTKVLELLGEPDVKSDSPTVENWLFKYDSARNKEQIWIDAVVVQIADGKVSNVRHAPTRLGIREMLESVESRAK